MKALRAVFRRCPFRVPRLRLAALKARQPFLKPILAYFFGRPGLATRLQIASGIKVGQLLTCYFLLVWVTLVTGFDPLFPSINKILVNFAAAGMRSDVGNHISTVASSVIDHQLQTVPAAPPGVMGRANPRPMLTVRGDKQKKSIPAHPGCDRSCVLLFQSFFPVFQRE